jgi:8-amino-7-oxononanoate synthase
MRIMDYTRCSYLGLDNHPILQGAVEKMSEYQSLHWSCARTRLNFSITQELEEELSYLFNSRVTTFSSVFFV